MELAHEEQVKFFEYCLREYPKEACGFVVSGKFIPTPNTHKNPNQQFRIDPVHWVKAEQFGKIEAVLHSHPYSPKEKLTYPAEWISAWDMKYWMSMKLPWGIVSTNGEGCSQILWYDDDNPEPLIGRQFVHGLNDCYSVIRDWYRLERGITLKNYARDMEWWHKGQDLYSENFRDAGFVDVTGQPYEVGDVVMMQIMAPVINHAGVVSGENKLLHHAIHRLSYEDQLRKWDRVITKTVRYAALNT